jgi:hypothetical protein
MIVEEKSALTQTLLCPMSCTYHMYLTYRPQAQLHSNCSHPQPLTIDLMELKIREVESCMVLVDGFHAATGLENGFRKTLQPSITCMLECTQDLKGYCAID